MTVKNQALEWAALAASKDDSRPVLGYVKAEAGAYVACDGFRIRYAEDSMAGEGFIPAKPRARTNIAAIQWANDSLVYPDWRRLIRDIESAEAVASLDCREIIALCDRAIARMSKRDKSKRNSAWPIIRLMADDQGVIRADASPSPRAYDNADWYEPFVTVGQMPATGLPNSLRIAFQAHMLRQAMISMTGDPLVYIVMHYFGSTGPARFAPSPDRFEVIMPVFTSWPSA